MKYNVLQTFEATVQTAKNRYNFQQAQLFEMGLRINKKRRFLFVSKVLGKHLAVHPAVPRLTSHLLAYQFLAQRFQVDEPFAEKISEAIQTTQFDSVLEASLENKIALRTPTTIIGFAETATALGHSFFEKFSGDVQFVHTTRESLVDEQPIIAFEEEHSHATSHRVYGDAQLFDGQREIILVDDEMTTGKTNCNIIRQLHEKYPHIQTYTVVSILDFRSTQSRAMMQRLAKELNIHIHSVSLYEGTFTITEIGELFEEAHTTLQPIDKQIEPIQLEATLAQSLLQKQSYTSSQHIQRGNYYSYSGRFYLTTTAQQQLAKEAVQIAEKLKARRQGGKCLVLGTGEFMYVPLAIAAQMGRETYFHATTRSPIFAHDQSLIYNKMTFASGEYPGAINYVYNIPEQTYTDIFVIYERILDANAVATLQHSLQRYAKNVHIVTLGGVEHAVYS